MHAPVLLTGATGYIGGRLLRRFEDGGRAVRCLVRKPERLHGSSPSTEIVQGDCLDESSLERALAGVTCAYYLVHSMGRGPDFADVDRRAAGNFARVARRAGVRRIVYLGGLTDEASSLSAHLKSRVETGAILRDSGVPVIECRASVVIGAGSLSFEMIQALVERLPIMICPRWVETLTQPIAIDDVLAYLEAALDAPGRLEGVFEIGGPEVVSYGDMMRMYAKQRGLRRLLLPVPVLTPHLSGLWLALVTPAQARVGRALVEGLKNSTIVRSPAARRTFRVEPKPLAEAVARALDEGAPTRLKLDTRTVVVDVPPAQAFAPIRRVGGEAGWYFGDVLWRARGWVDRCLGGVGMNRGRRHPNTCAIGDTIDGWTVEAFEADRRLRLSADFKLPGQGWLDFEVTPIGDGRRSRIRQTATFDPRGLMGRAYWYAILPVHNVIFAGLLDRIARRASGGSRRLARAVVTCFLALACVGAGPLRAAAQDTTGIGTLSGVVAAAADVPVAFATVCLSGTTQCVVADERGTFRLENIRAGQYALDVTPPGAAVVALGRLDVRAGVEQWVDIVLPDATALETTVTVTAPSAMVPEEVRTSGYLVTSEQVLRSAGSLQDVSRYVQTLPGVVVGSDDFRNDIIVRGGSPLENLFVVDNVEIPNINTFANFASAGGTVSILEPSMIRDVTFLTGGYPASYSNRTSSVLQITQREGSRESAQARATLGFAGAGGTVEGPLAAGRGSWVVSARRSFLDLFASDVGIGGVPVLYTVNAKVVYDLNATDRIWAVNISGVDRIRLGLTDSTPNDEEVFNFDIRYRGRRSATGVNWQHLFGTRGVGLLGVTNSIATVGSTVKDLVRDGMPVEALSAEQVIAASPLIYRDDSSESETTVKYDATLSRSAATKFQLGGSVKRFRVRYDSAAPLGYDSPYSLQPGVNAFRLSERFTAWQPGAYAQATHHLTSALNITAGGRFDRYQFIDASRFSPRLAGTLALTSRLSLKGSTGIYYQQPAFQFLAVFPENRMLEPFRADHFVGGVAYAVADGWTLDIEAYRKDYRDYPVATEFPSVSLANLGDTFNVQEALFPLTSAGVGRSRGVEIGLTLKDNGRWYGQMNLSLSESRHAARDGVLRPGSFDYPLVFNLTGGRRWSERWESAFRVAYLSGRPYTPFDAGESTRQRRGIFDLSRVNAVRGPAYFRVDARLDWNVTVNGEPVIVFLGVQNLTGRRNVSGYTWNRRTNAPDAREQLGVFPLIGMEWRF